MSMISIQRTNASDTDFLDLIKHLDADLKITDGDDHEFYDQFNKIKDLSYCVLAYIDEEPVGCGAIKTFNEDTMEVKRMFVFKGYRGQGVATMILNELEIWTRQLEFSACVLETGINQPQAIALYKKNGYQIIDNYGQYKGLTTSICFKKKL